MAHAPAVPAARYGAAAAAPVEIPGAPRRRTTSAGRVVAAILLVSGALALGVRGSPGRAALALDGRGAASDDELTETTKKRKAADDDDGTTKTKRTTDDGDDGSKKTKDDDGGDDASAVKSDGRAPHIVFVVGDDIGWNDVSYNNASNLTNQVRTPHIDRLAADGLKLTRFYTQCDCTPSRAALLTGLLPINTGMFHESIAQTAGWGLPSGFELLPSYLKARGYRAVAIGKWDVGHYTWDHVPTSRGFDAYVGYYGASEDYFCHHCCGGDIADSIVGKCVNRSLYDFNRDGVGEPAYHEYSTAFFEAEAEAALRKHAAAYGASAYRSRTPLFLYLAHQAIHTPAQSHGTTLRAALERFLPEASDMRAKVAAAAEELDVSVGELRAALEREGMMNETLLVFISDNGASLGQAGGGSNWPLRGAKFTPFEGGLRVPAFIYSPSVLPAARRGGATDTLVHVTDWLPTLLRVAGASSADVGRLEIDGISQYEALFEGGNTTDERTMLLLHADNLGCEARAAWRDASAQSSEPGPAPRPRARFPPVLSPTRMQLPRAADGHVHGRAHHARRRHDGRCAERPLEARRQHDVRVRVQPRLGRVPLGRALLHAADRVGRLHRRRRAVRRRLRQGVQLHRAVRARERPVRNHRPQGVEARRVRARARALRGRGAPDGRRRVHVRLRVRDVVRQPVHDVGRHGELLRRPVGDARRDPQRQAR